MSDHALTEARSRPSPQRRALLALAATATIAAALLTVTALAVPAPATNVTLLIGGVLATAAALSVPLIVYYAESASQAQQANQEMRTRLERTNTEAHHLATEVLPALGDRVRSGISDATTAQNNLPVPVHEVLQRILQEVAQELVATRAAERSHNFGEPEDSAVGQEATRFLDELLPELVQRVRWQRESADTALDEMPTPDHEVLHRLWEPVAQEISTSERRGAAAMTACAGAAARIQAQVTTLLAELRELEFRYGDQERIFGDLLDVDHRVSQMGRLADTVAVLSGGRSGRRWTKPIPMEGILRGAMGRISSFRRIRTHSTTSISVVGYAAEGVIHALSELMDNATGFSAQGTEVHVYVEEEPTGVVMRIEDGGLGMRHRERRRAEEVLDGPQDLTSLVGTRLGLAVVSRLAAKYKFSVSFRPSSRGGTGVVVLLPQHLLSHSGEDRTLPPRKRAEARAAARRSTREQSASTATGGGTATLTQAPPAEDSTTADSGSSSDAYNLPQRRRGATLAASLSEYGEAASPPKEQPPHLSNPTSRFAAFQQARSQPRTEPKADTEPPE